LPVLNTQVVIRQDGGAAGSRKINENSRADPGLFSGGGAPFSGGGALLLEHQIFRLILKKNIIKNDFQEGVHTPCTPPLDPPLKLIKTY